MTYPVGKAAALLLVAALSAACSSPKREECRALTTLINASADRFDKGQASVLDPTGLKALADVQQQAKDYASLVRNVAKTARAMAAAAEGGDLEKAKAANTEMEKLVADEPKLIAAVNKVCSVE
jgi:hypothetical protein